MKTEMSQTRWLKKLADRRPEQWKVSPQTRSATKVVATQSGFIVMIWTAASKAATVGAAHGPMEGFRRA